MHRVLEKWRGRTSRGLRTDRGFILIVVISTLGVLALVAAGFAQITTSHVRAAASAVQSAGAEMLADSGVQLAILDLVAARQPNGRPRRFALDGTVQVCDAGNGNRLAIAVQDEAGKVDVNVAGERLLRALLAGLGIPANAAIADAVMDYRDADNDRRPQGAERIEYREAGRPHGPKNAPLSVVDELEQVLGLSAADVALLRPYVTVYSGQTAIEQTSASPALIGILSRGHRRAGVSTTTEEPAKSEPDEAQGPLPPEFVGGAGRRVFAVRSLGYAGRALFVRDAIVEIASSRDQPYVLHRWVRGALLPGAALPGEATEPLPGC